MKYIMISAIWCPSCIIMRPRYQKLLGNIPFQELDFDDDEDEINKYNIGKTLPVFIVLDNNLQSKENFEIVLRVEENEN